MIVRAEVKNNKSVLRIGDMKLVASNPSIQPFNSYIYNNESDIMYFYYTLQLFQKKYKGQWKLVKETYVTEFGALRCLAQCIDDLFEIDVKNEGIKRFFIEKREKDNIIYSKDEYEASYPYFINGMFKEDCYNFVKKYRTFTDCRGLMEFELYDLNIAIGGNELGTSPIGFFVENLERKEVEQIKLFAQNFMNIASEKAKECVKNYLYSDEDSEYNEPKIVREYLKEKYNIDNWVDIFLKISQKEYVLNAFIEYIKGKLKAEDVKCHEWHGENRSFSELLKTMKDYEAFLYIVEENEYK